MRKDAGGRCLYMLTVVATHDKSNISLPIMRKSNPNGNQLKITQRTAYLKSLSRQETNNYNIQTYNHDKKQQNVQMGEKGMGHRKDYSTTNQKIKHRRNGRIFAQGAPANS